MPSEAPIASQLCPALRAARTAARSISPVRCHAWFVRMTSSRYACGSSSIRLAISGPPTAIASESSSSIWSFPAAMVTSLLPFVPAIPLHEPDGEEGSDRRGKQENREDERDPHRSVLHLDANR